MSRIGKQAIQIPPGVQVEIRADEVKATGPLGTMTRRLPAVLHAQELDGKILLARANDQRTTRALHGLHRNLVRNLVQGVSTGFERSLSIEGTGYRAEVQGDTLQMSLGFAHPVRFRIPQGVQVQVEKLTLVRLRGMDKELVGDTAARIRAKKPPEPYRGKGVRYLGEVIKKKVGKAGAK